jgi:hypothetical protein
MIRQFFGTPTQTESFGTQATSSITRQRPFTDHPETSVRGQIDELGWSKFQIFTRDMGFRGMRLT